MRISMNPSASDKSSPNIGFKISYMLMLFLIFSGIIIFFIAYDTITLQTPPADILVTDWADDWTISRNGHAITISSLTKYNTGTTKDNTFFTLKRRLDEELCFAPCLLVRLPQAKLAVLIDDKEVFCYNRQADRSTKMAARTHAFVPLSEEYAGKELTLVITATDGFAFYGLGPVLYGSQPELMQFFLRQRRLPFLFGLFLIMFGVAQLIYLPFLMNTNNPDWTLIIGALTSFICGMYLLSYYGIFDLFLNNPNANTAIEYLSLYSIPGLMCSYFLTESEGKYRSLYTGFVIFDELFLLTVFLLHILGLVFVTKFLIPFNFIMFIEGLPFISIWFRVRKRRKNLYVDDLQGLSNNIIIFALTVYTVCYYIDGFLFWISRIFEGREHSYGIPFIMFGSIIFSVLLAAHYFLHSICTLRSEVITHSLEEKAFADSLSGLSNRAMCQQVLEKIGSEKTAYHILSMDLDRLKTVNDTLGHIEGDRLISTFAGALKESFAGARLIGRMGGDEFIVILTDQMCGEVNRRLNDLQYKLDALNAKDDVLTFSVSVGGASNTDTELGSRAFDIYMLADKRMYDMKQKRHAEKAAKKDEQYIRS